MSGEGQRPPVQDDAPEPGNARYPAPQAAPGGNGQGGQPAEGGGRRRFRRQRRGGRGRGRNKQGGQQQQAQNQPGYAPPLDSQGRIFDIENEAEGDDEGPDEVEPG